MRRGEADGNVLEGQAAASASSLERISGALGVPLDTFYEQQTDRQPLQPIRSPAEQRRALLLAFDQVIDTAARERCVRFVEAEAVPAPRSRGR